MAERHGNPAAEHGLGLDEMGSSDRRTFLRRAGLAGAAAVAWSAPQLVSMPVASAQGTCAPVTLDWDNFTADSTFNSTLVGGITVGVTTTALAATTLLSTNRTIRATPNGGFTGQALQLQQLPNASGIGQDVDITFSSPVSNVSFSFYDIDNQTGSGWGDRIRIDTTPFTFNVPSGSNVIGNGTGNGNNRFRNSVLNDNLDDDEALGNVTLTWAGPLSLIEFRYTNAVNTGGGNMRIGISDITFTPC
jgi:hypothetical protein